MRKIRIIDLKTFDRAYIVNIAHISRKQIIHSKTKFDQSGAKRRFFRSTAEPPLCSPLCSKFWVLSSDYLTSLSFKQTWLPTVQDVLHADWQEVWHSPHPDFSALVFIPALFRVLMCFSIDITFFHKTNYTGYPSETQFQITDLTDSPDIDPGDYKDHHKPQNRAK